MRTSASRGIGGAEADNPLVQLSCPVQRVARGVPQLFASTSQVIIQF